MSVPPRKGDGERRNATLVIRSHVECKGRVSQSRQFLELLRPFPSLGDAHARLASFGGGVVAIGAVTILEEFAGSKHKDCTELGQKPTLRIMRGVKFFEVSFLKLNRLTKKA